MQKLNQAHESTHTILHNNIILIVHITCTAVSHTHTRRFSLLTCTCIFNWKRGFLKHGQQAIGGEVGLHGINIGGGGGGGRVQNYVSIIRECCTFRVECVSPTSAGVTVQMIQVLAFPPRDDCSILVSLDSLNGMWALDT